jgi:hypothetical protein
MQRQLAAQVVPHVLRERTQMALDPQLAHLVHLVPSKIKQDKQPVWRAAIGSTRTRVAPHLVLYAIKDTLVTNNMDHPFAYPARQEHSEQQDPFQYAHHATQGQPINVQA